ncbi:MAG: DUF1080 domain-containing protein [Verrucomicrobia bacterium]|nr:DUF1080 domain-containing protein [Verrucomicrobiota bacterium]
MFGCHDENTMPQRQCGMLLIRIWIALQATCHLSASEDEDFTTLFNGKDLQGWVAVGTPDAFVVRDSAIFSTGTGPYPSWLRTEQVYENFVLRFEYQTEGWYEGGFLLHAPFDGPASKLGFKIHLRHEQKAYGLRSPGAIYDVAAPRSIANLPSGEWNTCEITCDWPRLRVTLNDKLIHDLSMDTEPGFRNRLRRGYMGIQNIGCRASFRNLRIRALPDQDDLAWRPCKNRDTPTGRWKTKCSRGRARMASRRRGLNSPAPSNSRFG